MSVLFDILLERLATLALDKIQQEMNLVIGVKEEIETLTTKLEAIRAVLEDAEQKQHTEASVKLWLNKLNEVSFDMDDVLDGWITRVLMHQQQKIEDEDEETEEIQGGLVDMMMKVCFPCSSTCFRFGTVDYQLFLRHEIAHKIEELNKRLDLIALNKQAFTLEKIQSVVPQLSQKPETTSDSAKTVFGRDWETNLIISKLLREEGSDEKEIPLIIPIVGMGGLGKTTLAQLVYNDERIKSHFDKSIWVCVSEPFEEKRIARAIIEGLGSSNNSDVLQTLIVCINELIKGKKYLLVLDDVWNPTSSQWGELIKPLEKGSSGSRVLVTTRKEEVATLMRAQSQMITVDRLGEEFCLSLFYYNAGRDESKESKVIKAIGVELVKRCKGLPLAAKTLGSLMYNKKQIHEWQAVLNSKTWELKEMQQDVFRPLLLSYNDLTPAIKQCLLYCALFPKDYEYDKSTLIELWMSQDYLNVKNQENKMIVGENYFHDLLMRSFFQDVMLVVINNAQLFKNLGKVTCKIHDITHDFLRSLVENEINQVECDGCEIMKMSQMTKEKVHHLNLKGAPDLVSNCLIGYKRLRTLIVQLDKHSDSDDKPVIELLVPSKSLRTLTIDTTWSASILSIPKNIGEVIHLRYLDLSGNIQLEELPSAVCSLYNLQTLRLVGCKNLMIIDVRRLINLRHLYVDDCYSLRKIKGIERLKYLQTLDKLEVSDGENNTNKLDDLKDLNQLQGTLRIYLDKKFTISQNNVAVFVNKTHLQRLIVSFGFADSTIELLVMNVLEPPPALEYLSLYNYKGRVFSNWLLTLHCLRFLFLTGCKECKMLPPLGNLASLESLSIYNLDSVPKIGVEFLGIEKGQASPSFPKLKTLELAGLYSCNEWEAGVEEEEENNIPIMPCLLQLNIYVASELKALPDFLWKTPLQKLDISYSPTLKDIYRRQTGELAAKISHIQTILFDNNPW